MTIRVSSAEEALAVTEILEQILTCLLESLDQPSNREDANSQLTQSNAAILLHLLQCAAVNKTWKHCILHGSQPLRRCLYLLPDSRSPRSWEHGGRVYASQATAYRDLSASAPSLNPVVQTLFSSCNFRFWRSGLEAEGPRHRAYLILTRKRLQVFNQAISNGYGENILSMLLAQPPPVEFTAEIWDREDADARLEKRSTKIWRPSIYCSAGVTIGLVFRRVTEMFDDHPDVTAIKVRSE